MSGRREPPGRRRTQSVVVRFSVVPIDEVCAREIAGWAYEGPHAAYNCPPGEVEDFVGGMLDPGNHYYAVRDETGALVGYCCFGLDARVPGGAYGAAADPSRSGDPAAEAFLDVGLGLRPDLTGRGLGAAFLEAIAAFAWEQVSHHRLRVTVAAWNERAIHLYEKAGFRRTHTFTHDTPGGRANGSTEWHQMTRGESGAPEALGVEHLLPPAYPPQRSR